MRVHTLGHWHGDPQQHCGELHLFADTQAQAAHLAALVRLFTDLTDEERCNRLARLADAADAIGCDEPIVVAAG